MASVSPRGVGGIGSGSNGSGGGRGSGCEGEVGGRDGDNNEHRNDGTPKRPGSRPINVGRGLVVLPGSMRSEQEVYGDVGMGHGSVANRYPGSRAHSESSNVAIINHGPSNDALYGSPFSGHGEVHHAGGLIQGGYRSGGNSYNGQRQQFVPGALSQGRSASAPASGIHSPGARDKSGTDGEGGCRKDGDENEADDNGNDGTGGSGASST